MPSDQEYSLYLQRTQVSSQHQSGLELSNCRSVLPSGLLDTRHAHNTHIYMQPKHTDKYIFTKYDKEGCWVVAQCCEPLLSMHEALCSVA